MNSEDRCGQAGRQIDSIGRPAPAAQPARRRPAAASTRQRASPARPTNWRVCRGDRRAVSRLVWSAARCHGDVQLDPGWPIMAGRHGKTEASAVANARGNSDLHRVPQQFEPAAATPLTHFGPGLTAAPAAAAGALDWDVEWHRGSLRGLTGAQLRPMRSTPAVVLPRGTRAASAPRPMPRTGSRRSPRRQTNSHRDADRHASSRLRARRQTARRCEPSDCGYDKSRPGRSQWLEKTVRCAARRCEYASSRSPTACQVRRRRKRPSTANGYALIAITSKKSKNESR